VLHSPLDRYQQLIDSGAFSADPQQLPAIQALDELWHALQQTQTSLLDRVRRRAPAVPRGLYLWGSVGRGKTWLMDLFYDCLPARRKLRTHFHRFMQKIHQDLGDLGRMRDPLDRIAANWARQTDVLCLDEFFVTDIGDAMLLAKLLDSLFARGVTLVTTSNIPPDELYRDGLQRAKFLPAIELIKQHTRVLHLPGDTDFRLRILEQSEIFHHPLDDAADRVMTRAFDRMTAASEMNHELDINGRSFHARRRGDGVIWFEFEELCEKPRGAIDYIEIARAFNTVVISNIPQLTDEAANATRRFITLVDEFYDRNVKLLLSAEVPLGELYCGGKMAFEFERTASRLTEMQSHDYLARPHLP
jgi:cell division protein ZapE